MIKQILTIIIVMSGIVLICCAGAMGYCTYQMRQSRKLLTKLEDDYKRYLATGKM